MCLIHSIGGAFKRQPEELAHKLSEKSSDLIKRAFEDIEQPARRGHGGVGADREHRVALHLLDVQGR